MIKHRFGSVSLLIACGGFAFACSGQAGEIDDSNASSTTGSELGQQSVAEIERLADEAVAAGIPGVSVAVIRGGQELSFARGVADRATG